jgi:dolichol-phosphate mannosyltransferase
MKTFIVIPSYNEKENIKNLIEEIFNLNIKDLEIVIVDDDSPDGTWKIVKELTKEYSALHLLHRKEGKGRGSAGVAGFKYALAHGADYLLEMDADFSHNPKYIPAFLERMNEADVVIGSRAVPGGGDVGRSRVRRVITRLANLYTRIVFGFKVRDCNSGFRCFKRKVIEDIDLDRTMSDGPAIVQEWLYKTHVKGFKIKEIPIVFKERELGQSKLHIKGLYKGYFMVLKLKLLSLMGKL